MNDQKKIDFSPRGRIWRRGEGKVSLFAVPNIITIVRIFFAPAIFFYTILEPNIPSNRIIAATFFLVGMATDGIDGFIARSRGLITEFGKLLDPIADKVLVATALISLSIIGYIPWWFTGIILLREIGITVFRFFALKDAVIPASRAGKLKTFTQTLAITLALANFGGLGEWAEITTWTLLWIAFALTVFSGAIYLVEAWHKNRDRDGR